MNLDSLFNQFTQAAGQRIQAVNTEADSQAAATGGIEELLASSRQKAVGAAETARTAATKQADVTANTEAAMLRASRTAGFDPTAVEDEFTRSIAEFNQSESQRKEVRKQFDAISGMNFFDNPVGYIIGQLNLPAISAEHNNLVDRSAAAAQNIAQRKQMLADYKSGAMVDNVAANKEIGYLKADAEFQAAQANLDAVAADHAGKIAARRLSEFQLRDKANDIRSDLLGKAISIEQWKEQRALRIEQAAMNRAAREAALKDKAEKDAWEAQMNTRLAVLSRARGMQVPMTITGVKQLPDPKQREAWLQAAYDGVFGRDLRAGIDFLAPSATAINQSNPELGRFMEAGNAALVTYQQNLQADVLTGKIKAKDVPEEATARYMTDVRNQATVSGNGNSMLSAHQDQVFNPYKVEGKQMLRRIDTQPQLAGLKENEFVKTLRTVAATDPTAPRLTADNEQAAIKALVKRVEAGELTTQRAAAAISEYYRVGTATNLDATNYNLFGFAPPSRYLGVISQTSYFGSPVEADLLNPASVENAVTKLVAQGKAASLSGLFGGSALQKAQQQTGKLLSGQ